MSRVYSLQALESQHVFMFSDSDKDHCVDESSNFRLIFFIFSIYGNIVEPVQFKNT